MGGQFIVNMMGREREISAACQRGRGLATFPGMIALKRGRGRPKGSVAKDTFQERVLRKYPGIDKLLGDPSLSMREIADRYGINRESVRRMERGFGLTPRRELQRVGRESRGTRNNPSPTSWKSLCQ
jgi:hypothetical protein